MDKSQYIFPWQKHQVCTGLCPKENGHTSLTLTSALVVCSFAKDLLFYADHVPTVSTQLSILASVKAATPEDRTVRCIFTPHPHRTRDVARDVT